MFPIITDLESFQKTVSHKKEIVFRTHPNGVTIACYMFQDSKTFDSPETLECRGIAFDRNGKICSRPLHKFFNLGERQDCAEQRAKRQIEAIYEKVDGSMIATAWVDGELALRSKKSFDNDVVKLAWELLRKPENYHLRYFANHFAMIGKTLIMELLHPEARIVVDPVEPQLRVTALRDNVTGEYEKHFGFGDEHNDVFEYDKTFDETLASLESMAGQEGYVVRYTDGHMIKMKCPWYTRLHKAVTFLRERDIALLALDEQLDDVKAALKESGIDLTEVEKVETRVLGAIVDLENLIYNAFNKNILLDRKSFAIALKDAPWFSCLMNVYSGKESGAVDWYKKNMLKTDFSLRALSNVVDEL